MIVWLFIFPTISLQLLLFDFFFFSSRRRHTRWPRDWSSDVCSSDLFDPLPFLTCLLVGILILPLQTTAEEVFIRGYLMQQIGLLVPYRWIPVLVTSVFFGLLHTQNAEVLQFGLYKAMALYIGMGLFLGLITAMDDGLEIPMGIHYVNNLFSLLFVGYKGSVFEGTPTIFLKEAEDLTFASVISNLVVMGIVLFILKFIFRWPKFRRLFRKIDTTIG